jgi:hypothetical protein
VRLRLELLAQAVQRVLGLLQQHQPARPKAHDLPYQFRTDRPAGAGHQHAARAQPVRQPRVVQLHRIAPEQVVELERAQCAHRHPPVQQIVQRRHGVHRKTSGRA